MLEHQIKSSGSEANDNLAVNMDLLQSVPEAVLAQHRVLPIDQQAGQIVLACTATPSTQALTELRFLFACNVSTRIISESQMLQLQQMAAAPIDRFAAQLARPSRGQNTDPAAPAQEQISNDLTPDAREPRTAASATDRDTAVVEFVDQIILTAVRDGCSDIHFEPYAKHYRIRYRQDGMLHEVVQPPPERAAELAARIKAMANMDVANKRSPQDGHIRLSNAASGSDASPTDIRVSTLPTLYGEKVVLRVLDSQSNSLTIDELGMTDPQRDLLHAAISQPAGMILVTGPTGSGKTITLYSVLHQLNRIGRNICTVEDPAEIAVDGINQVSIQPKAGLDFPSTLRAFLRQDPDIIMVGEIRDRETAEIAVKAAQTGHLLLSTLHTNDAPQTLQRLNNIGIPNYQLAGCIQLIIAQRLVRKLCNHCKQPTTLPTESYAELGITNAAAATLYKAVGCKHCRDGYRGRTGIFQLLPITSAVARQIAGGLETAQIAEQAADCGFSTLRQEGLRKVVSGVTSIEELDRVVSP